MPSRNGKVAVHHGVHRNQEPKDAEESRDSGSVTHSQEVSTLIKGCQEGDRYKWCMDGNNRKSQQLKGC